jgi:hypothetical protein
MRRFVADQPAGGNAHRSPLLAMTLGNGPSAIAFFGRFIGLVRSITQGCQEIDVGPGRPANRA